MKKLTREEFIEKSNKIHGDKYDYSQVEYKNNITKVKIKCNICGYEFMRTPHHHLKINIKNGCKNCYSMSQKLTTSDFIKLAKKVHGDKYNYNLVNYNGCNKKVRIICNVHGDFDQTPNGHLNGHGCRKCITNTAEFIEKSQGIHKNKYDYSLVKYVNNIIKVKIICPTHGIFEKSPKEHVYGCGCPKCKISTKEFILKCQEIHGNKYDYSLVKYISSKDKIKIICKKHGIFYQLATNHKSGRGCPFCNESKGEIKVKNFLESKFIKYERQYVFKECKGFKNSKLPFDFYLPDYDCCIEYDGQQHYKIMEFFGGEEGLKSIERRDKIKTSFCMINNINLLRIKYDENIENVILKFLELPKNI